MSRQSSLSIVEYFAEHEGYKCGYCGKEDTNFSHGMWAHTLSTQDYQDLIDRGWRRSGQYCYKPTMNKTCCPLYTIKCEALNFKPTKSQKKVVKRFVNYILNDVRPGGGSSEENGTGKEETNEDCQEGDHLQKQIENVENSLKMDVDVPILSPTQLIKNEKDGTSSKDINEEKIIVTKNICDKEMKDETNPKFIKPKGMDPSKPKQGKAKLARIEKYKQKHGADQVLKPKAKNQEKSIEDLLEPLNNSSGLKHKWETKLIPASMSNESFSSSYAETVKIYQKYQAVIHNDTPDKCTEKQYRRFLSNSPLQTDSEGPPFGSYHYQYCIDGKIVAVGVLDVLPHSVSSVYLYYDPAFTFLSLGTLTSLLEICLVRDLARRFPSITHYYLGFYIHNCVKMRYKGRYSPSKLLCPEAYTWQPLDSCRPLLDASPYSRLDPDPRKEDRDAAVQIDQVGVLYCRQPVSYSVYQRLLAEEEDGEEGGDKEEVIEYSGLVGNTIARRMLLYRST